MLGYFSNKDGDIMQLKNISTDLNSLFKIIKKNYIYKLKNGNECSTLTKAEKLFYSNMPLKDSSIFVSICDDEIYSNDSIYSDIEKINTKKEIEFERMLFNIRMNFYIKSDCRSNDLFTKKLFSSLKNSYFITSLLEYKIRNVFSYLLKKHLKASENMSKEYLEVLKNLQRDLTFKYHIEIPESYEFINEYLKNNCESYDYDNFVNNYLDKMIMNIINYLLNISDEMYENDIIYAKGIAYQILLRSLFIIINDYNILAYYEQIYNDLEKNETIGKSIIKTAFISNYTDLIDYKKRKVKGN